MKTKLLFVAAILVFILIVVLYAVLYVFYNEYQSRVGLTEESVKSTTLKVSDIEARLNAIKDDVSKVNNSISSFSGGLSVLEEKYNASSADVSELKKTISTWQADLGSINSRLDALATKPLDLGAVAVEKSQVPVAVAEGEVSPVSAQ